jgi:hypothetical protein
MTDVKQIDGVFKLTVPVPMAFPTLYEPKAFMENGVAKGEPKYSGNFLFAADSSELRGFKELAAKLARAKWPDRQFFVTTTDGQKIRQVVFPWYDGTTRADEMEKAGKKGKGDYMRGKVVVPAKSKNPPILSYIDKGKLVECDNDTVRIAAKAKFYAGVLVLAEFNLVAYDPKGKDGLPGVTAYLNKVLSTNKGEKIAGGTSSSEAFSGYLGSVSMTDPTHAPGAGENIDDLL